jgi:hypothetical protein
MTFDFLKGLTDAEFVCLSKNMTGLLREARYEKNKSSECELFYVR